VTSAIDEKKLKKYFYRQFYGCIGGRMKILWVEREKGGLITVDFMVFLEY